jgi:hypothetical protein
MQFYFVTPVWGVGHLELFLSVGLPSLVAPGNLSGLADAATCRFLIYTRPDDEARLRGATVFQRLALLMPVEIHLIREPITVPHRTMSDCHADAMRRADEDDAAAVFVPPDCVWADGCMVRLEQIARSGKSVVHMTGIRLDRDAVVPRLRELLSADGCALQIAPRPLVTLGLAHLHTIAYGHFWNEHDGGLMPANLYWTVPGEGLAVRCFHLHPLMVRSQVRFAHFGSTIDDDLALFACPDVTRDYVVTDSDEILAFELSGQERIVGADFRKGSVASVASWAELGANERHRLLARHAIRIHSGPVTEGLWRPIELQGDRTIAAVARINRLPWPLLALRHPSVLSWRFYAMALKGSLVPARYRFWSRLIPNAVFWLLSSRRRLYAGIFLQQGQPRVWHPRWLICRSASTAVLDAIAPGDHRVILVGGDAGIVAPLERQRPGLSVTALDPNALQTWRQSLDQPMSGTKPDLVVGLDLEGDAGTLPIDALSALLPYSKRVILLGLTPPSPASATASRIVVELRLFGGHGTQFAYRVWRRLRRSRDRVNKSPFRLPVKLAGLLVSPILLPVGAICSLALNLVGLGSDAVATAGQRSIDNQVIDGMMRRDAPSK